MKKDSQAERERVQIGGSDPRIKQVLRELESAPVIDILVVTSGQARCESLKRALAALGQRVLIASSTEQALKIFYSTAFNLVLCDQGTNDTACEEFAAHLRTLVPRQRILMLDFE